MNSSIQEIINYIESFDDCQIKPTIQNIKETLTKSTTQKLKTTASHLQVYGLISIFLFSFIFFIPIEIIWINH